MATVSLDHVIKRFGAFTAVHDLSLDIADREFLVLLGPSGCGKTTTMRMIAGLEDLSEGEIRIDGERVNDKPARDRDLAMVFQNYGLYPHMTVAENIGYPLKIRRVPKARRVADIRAAAERVELAALLDRRPGQLSGGQRQRVALARAIIRTPRLFLMDEPLSNLDAKLRTVMRAQIKHLQRDLATTTIYVTHDQVEAMTLADRIVIMKDGRIQQSGRPAEIYARPANVFVAGFVGAPPMNLIAGEAVDGAFRHHAGTVALNRSRTGRLTLGARPEVLTLCATDEADLVGSVFSVELLGDVALVGVSVGPDIVTVKSGPDIACAMGEAVGIRFPRDGLHIFDPASGTRVGGEEE